MGRSRPNVSQEPGPNSGAPNLKAISIPTAVANRSQRVAPTVFAENTEIRERLSSSLRSERRAFTSICMPRASCLSRLLRRQKTQERFRGTGRRRRVLPGNQASIDHVKRLPVGKLLGDRSEPHQFILDQERHPMGELHRFLFAVGETGNALSLHKRRALVSYMPKYAR